MDTKGAAPLTGWENPAGLLRGRAAGEWLSNLAQHYQESQDETLVEKASYMVQELRSLQLLSEGMGWGRGYLGADSPEQFTLLENGGAFPNTGAAYAVCGSLLNGLLDTYDAFDSQADLHTAESLGKWITERSSGYTQEQKKAMWSQDVSGDTQALGGALARLARINGRHPLWACVQFSDSGEISRCAEALKGYLHYGVTACGFPGWYDEEYVKNCKWEPFKTPVKILSKIKSDICQEQMEEAGKNLDRFTEYLQEHSFRKEEVRQAMIRCYFMVSGLLQDLDKKCFQKLQSYHLEHTLNQILTWEEMKQYFGRIREVLVQGKARRQDISNYIIVKVLNYIQEHYREKIVLDEVAVQMGLTPEYLSTLFNREVKENFTVFLKKFRIDHAKRLLTGTDKKIYEVAQEVGYSDAKYFIKVFKEEEGISPGDYREMQH